MPGSQIAEPNLVGRPENLGLELVALGRCGIS